MCDQQQISLFMNLEKNFLMNKIMFTKKSGAVIYGIQIQSAQQMLDFDYLSGRDPSVIAFINE